MDTAWGYLKVYTFWCHSVLLVKAVRKSGIKTKDKYSGNQDLDDECFMPGVLLCIMSKHCNSNILKKFFLLRMQI